jgi:hypothetical protein
LIETGISTISKASLVRDATKIWNRVLKSKTEAKTVYTAEKFVKSYC